MALYSPMSLPSSPEPYSDEDNHPQTLGWWEARPRDPPRRRRPEKRRRSSEGPFVHNPTPDDVAKMNNRSEMALERRLAFLEKQEREELAAEERKAAKKWYPVREDKATKRLREENLRPCPTPRGRPGRRSGGRPAAATRLPPADEGAPTGSG